MVRSQVPTVRMERQPHRDAVNRVRAAYRRLRPDREQPELASSPPHPEAGNGPPQVQEVSE
jgi:hypothetical protein